MFLQSVPGWACALIRQGTRKGNAPFHGFTDDAPFYGLKYNDSLHDSLKDDALFHGLKDATPFGGLRYNARYAPFHGLKYNAPFHDFSIMHCFMV